MISTAEGHKRLASISILLVYYEHYYYCAARTTLQQLIAKPARPQQSKLRINLLILYPLYNNLIYISATTFAPLGLGIDLAQAFRLSAPLRLSLRFDYLHNLCIWLWHICLWF